MSPEWIEQLKLLFYWYESAAIAFLLVANSSYLVILVLGFINSRRRYIESRMFRTFTRHHENLATPISILVPCYNEQLSIQDTIRSLVSLRYPDFEIIVVNDGSTDETLSVLIEQFSLQRVDFELPKVLPCRKIRGVYKSSSFQRLTVVDKENGGKSDALNAAINHARHPLVSCIDADCILDERGLALAAMPFFDRPSETVAVGGAIRVANGSKISGGRLLRPRVSSHPLSMVQSTEYLRAFLIGRVGWDFIDCNTIISGAFGVFNKAAIIEVGGYSSGTVGEDLEILLRIHHSRLRSGRAYHVEFLPSPICWTEVPTDLRTLGNQRSRWQQGLLEGLWLSRGMFFRPWAGRVGSVILPYLLVFELIAAPMELFSYLMTILGISFGVLDREMVALFFVASVVYAWVVSIGAIMIEELTFQKYQSVRDYLKLLGGAFLDQLGYHQLNLWYRMRGMWRYFRGERTWGKMLRSGVARAG